jgi:hypothetical protein
MKIKILAQENNWVRLFAEMMNASALSEKKPPWGGPHPCPILSLVIFDY